MTSCTPTPTGAVCPEPSGWSDCRPYNLANDDRLNCYMESLADESLELAGARVNVFKLLGVHEQTKLIDLTGDGKPLTGGDAPGFPASNAFSKFTVEWRSKQSGASNITASAFIGYDFGVVKIPNGRQRYGIDASIRHQITAIKIKQGSDPLSRATKVRVERSEDGKQWYGVAILTLPNDDNLNTLYFRESVPNRYWRVRPVTFVGTLCDSWTVQALEMFDYTATDISNIQDKILLENRDRDYLETPLELKGYYELLSVASELTRFGIEMAATTYQIRVNFNTTVARLGRPIVVGDIIELPSEVQYTPDLRAVKRYLEVTDVTWDTTSYTAGWKPTMLMVTAQPAIASQETQDLFGDLSKHVDNSGLFDTDDGNNKVYQDLSTISQTINQTALSEVPERGSEGSNTIRHFTSEEIALADKSGAGDGLRKMNFVPTRLYVEDAIPQNGAPYTEGPEYPKDSKEGDYHRLTYEGLSKDIPTKLYRFSSTKNRWIYLETDRRKMYNDQQPVLTEYLTSPNKTPAKDIK